MTKKKIIGLLLVITALAAGLVPVYASTNQLTVAEKPVIKSKEKVQLKPVNSITAANPIVVEDISDLDETSIDDTIDKALEAEEIPEEDVNRAPPLWYLNAYGVTIAEDPVTDAAETRNRIRLQILAEKVRHTEYGALYKIHWGRVTHKGEKYDVEGYALLDSDGIFYMKLDGEVAFKSIGRIHPYWFGVRVSMKGYIVEDDITYSHKMRGWAIPLNLKHLARLRNIQQ